MARRYPNFHHVRRSANGSVPRSRRGRRHRGKYGFATEVVTASLFVGILSWNLAPQVSSSWSLATSSPEQIEAIERSAYYRNCNDARAAGAAPLYRGEPGYREEMDGDFDGIACEPYHGS